MATLWLLPACLLLAATVCPQDKGPSGPEISNGQRSFTLPGGWRQLTPDEARTLRSKLPADMRGKPDTGPTVPGTVDLFGRVDEWLRGRVDGRCLTVLQRDGEPALDAEALLEVPSWLEQRSADSDSGCEYAYVSGRRATVGTASHPVLEVVTRIQPGDGTKPMRALEVYAPSGGHTVILQFRAYEDDFATALPQFRQVLGTLVFAREPKGPANLSDRLQNAAIVGAIVGLVLLVLYKWSRK